jgi:hypothetical protein
MKFLFNLASRDYAPPAVWSVFCPGRCESSVATRRHRVSAQLAAQVNSGARDIEETSAGGSPRSRPSADRPWAAEGRDFADRIEQAVRVAVEPFDI